MYCKRCGYEWDYNGNSDWYASCPRCKTNIRVNGENKDGKNKTAESSCTG